MLATNVPVRFNTIAELINLIQHDIAISKNTCIPHLQYFNDNYLTGSYVRTSSYLSA